MRLLLGIILGVAFTIGGVYLRDTMITSTDASSIGKPMVNWDIVNQDWRRLTGRLHREWNRIATRSSA